MLPLCLFLYTVSSVSSGIVILKPWVFSTQRGVCWLSSSCLTALCGQPGAQGGGEGKGLIKFPITVLTPPGKEGGGREEPEGSSLECQISYTHP